MGQYWKVFNKTKRQFFKPHSDAIDNGAKLMEQVGFDRSAATALYLLCANSNSRGGGDAKPNQLIGSWAGDCIVVQGDYSAEGDPGFISDEEKEGYMDISSAVGAMLISEFDD